MGTGYTTTGSCRIGTANVGDLINAQNPEGVDYQRKMCSGDTTTGLDRQINEWTNPQNADIATITMGGNDLGFSDIVLQCLLVPGIWSDSYKRKMCRQAKNKANARLIDVGKDGIGYKLGAAYKRIVEKSTREVSICIRMPCSIS
jgi:lysophospholipase L1-like esterase